MIENDKQLKATRRYLEGMEKILSDMRKEDIAPKRRIIWEAPFLNAISKAMSEIAEYRKMQNESQTGNYKSDNSKLKFR